jgi:uncharacterized repeat protein (TIGR03837 family)
MPAMPRNALTVSLFAYPHAPSRALLQAFALDDEPVVCVVPEGVASDAVEAVGQGPARAGSIHRNGALTLVVAPFVDQRKFDARLWSCALNFVRGEDSFVRAQWAARPLVWQPYPQRERAHMAKLDAFLDRYVEQLEAGPAGIVRTLCSAWNAGDGAVVAASWPLVRDALPRLARHARHWSERLAATVPDLSVALLEFARNRL